MEKERKMKRTKREEEIDERFAYQGVPISKILTYVKKEDLIDIFGWDGYKTVIRQVQGNDPTRKVLLREIKSFISNSPELVAQIKEFVGIGGFYKKYMESAERLRARRSDVNYEKNAQIREFMRTPKKKYVGCLATKLKPEDFGDCLKEYDDPKKHYEKYGIIPYGKLRQDVSDKLRVQGRYNDADVLQMPVKAQISDLPRGLKQFYREHKEKYHQYMEEAEEVGRFLRNMERIIKNERDTEKRKQLWKDVLDYAQSPIEHIEVD
jgi:hypothetical protein